MHQVSSSPSPVFYSGSPPLSYSFAEANQKKYVLLTDVMPGNPAVIREVELTRVKPLLRKRAMGVEAALQCWQRILTH